MTPFQFTRPRWTPMVFLTCLLCGLCSAGTDADQREPAEASPKKQTFQEIIAARPEPDLSRLVERSSPDVRGPDATESFWDLLKIRETADPQAVPALEKILIENLPTTRIHGFAAAQALYSIGTPESLRMIDRHLLKEDYRADLAIMYTSHWEMREPQRSQLIGQYLLKNLSQSLVVGLEESPHSDPRQGRLELILTLRNAAQEPLLVVNPEHESRTIFYLRDAKERFIPQRFGFTESALKPATKVNYVPLKAGESHSITVQVRVQAGTTGADGKKSPHGLTVTATPGEAHVEVEDAGRYEFIALIEAAPLTDEQRKFLKLGDDAKVWAGRAVSKPVAVKLLVPVQNE